MSTVTVPEKASSRSLVANGDSLYEVVNGQRVELPPMSVYASWISSCVHGNLWGFTQRQRLGWTVSETLFILDSEIDLRRRPDVAFVSAQKWPMERPMPTAGDWAIVPDLAIEVVSPNDLFAEVVAKIREYFSYGLKQAWVVLPSEAKVYVYHSPTNVQILGSGGELDGGTLIPGFHLPLATLFLKPETANPPATK